MFDLLHEIRPDFLGAAPRPTKAQIRATQRGSWGEWSYYIHGRGCRLVHARTREPIEWDSPDLQTFDPSWFAHWLEWWSHDTDEAAARTLVGDAIERAGGVAALVKDTLAALEREGSVRHLPDRAPTYERR